MFVVIIMHGAKIIFFFRLISVLIGLATAYSGLVVMVSDWHARGGGFEAASTHNKMTIGEGR